MRAPSGGAVPAVAPVAGAQRRQRASKPRRSVQANAQNKGTPSRRRRPAAPPPAAARPRIAFIPFLCAGDPDLDTTALALQKLDAIGADVIELGVPYSVRGLKGAGSAPCWLQSARQHAPPQSKGGPVPQSRGFAARGPSFRGAARACAAGKQHRERPGAPLGVRQPRRPPHPRPPAPAPAPRTPSPTAR